MTSAPGGTVNPLIQKRRCGHDASKHAACIFFVAKARALLWPGAAPDLVEFGLLAPGLVVGQCLSALG